MFCDRQYLVVGNKRDPAVGDDTAPGHMAGLAHVTAFPSPKEKAAHTTDGTTASRSSAAATEGRTPISRR